MSAPMHAVGPPYLANDLVFVLLEDNHQLAIDHKLASIGMAAAVLAELVQSGHVSLVKEQVRAVGRGGVPPRDPVCHNVETKIRAEPALPVGTWLAFLAVDDIFARVVERMTISGLIHTQTTRRMLRAPVTTYEAIDPKTGWWPMVRLRSHLRKPYENPLTAADACLLGIAAAIGMRGRLLYDTPPSAAAIIDQLPDRLPGPYGDLVRHTNIAAAKAAMT